MFSGSCPRWYVGESTVLAESSKSKTFKGFYNHYSYSLWLHGRDVRDQPKEKRSNLWTSTYVGSLLQLLIRGMGCHNALAMLAVIKIYSDLTEGTPIQDRVKLLKCKNYVAVKRGMSEADKVGIVWFYELIVNYL